MKAFRIISILSIFIFVGSFTACESSPKSKARNANHSADWLDNEISYFYKHKDYDRACELLLAFFDSSSSLNHEAAWYMPVAYFFSNIFKTDVAFAELKEIYKSASEDERMFIGIMLALYHTEKHERTLKDINELETNKDLKAVFLDISEFSKSNDPLKQEVKTAEHLDILWGIFFATGDTLPIKKIASVLAWEDLFKKKILAYKPANKKEKEEFLAILSAFNIEYTNGKLVSPVDDCDIQIIRKQKQDKQVDNFQRLVELLAFTYDELYHVATKTSAFWSLSSNASFHEIVHAECLKIAENKSLPESKLMLYVLIEATMNLQ
ncbi:MAG: hypothetical protein P1P59_09505 [Treponemataceae bacterium]